jgi:hypothetical protein
VRDLARVGKQGFRSDVDLVIGAPVADVQALAARLSARPNRFGGYTPSSQSLSALKFCGSTSATVRDEKSWLLLRAPA